MAFVQRFDSALRWNVPIRRTVPHVAWLDGVFSWQPGRGEVAWREDEGLTDADVAALVRRIVARVQKVLKKAGKWWDEGDAADASTDLDGAQQTMLAGIGRRDRSHSDGRA